jgi:hypothetical protein
MIPADIDPSLCTGEPLLERLDDGFSPPNHETTDPPPAEPSGAPPADLALPPKSPF